MDAIEILKILLLFVSTLILTVLFFLMIELLRVAISVRKVIVRFSTLTQIDTWVKIYQYIPFSTLFRYFRRPQR